MTREEYEKLKAMRTEEPKIDVMDLEYRTPRTLISGYTCDRDNFDLILLYKYDPCFSLYIRGDLVFMGQKIEMQACVPDKRVYPAKSDYEFCLLLKNHGVYLPFTTFIDEV